MEYFPINEADDNCKIHFIKSIPIHWNLQINLKLWRIKYTIKPLFYFVCLKDHFYNFITFKFQMESSLVLSGTLSQQHGTTTKKENKNYYVARNAGCAHSRYNLKLSLIFFKINQWMNQLINRVYLERLISS